MNIILFGPQGCGKGTQAKKLVEKYSLTHISPGELFRAEVAKGSEMGKKVKEYLDKGLLVPKEINFKIVKDKLEELGFKDFILDGFPRNQEQADYLDTIAVIDFAIEIDVSEEESIKRISSRRLCSKCGEGYNTIYIKPKKEGVCNKCGGKIIQRDDDKPEAVKKRLQIYHEQTSPLLEHYKSVYHKVHGEKPIEDVFNDLVEVLEV